MPQASEQLRALMRAWFGDITETGPIAVLESHGFKLTPDWYWELPVSNHTISDMEWTLISFLVDEWDYGELVQHHSERTYYGARWNELSPERLREIMRSHEPMSPARKALEASIAHWEELASSPNPEHLDGEHCPLCQAFWEREGNCSNCPIGQKTRLEQCKGTPWFAAYEVWVRWRHNGRTSEDLDRFHLAAKEEVKFLQELLETLP